MCCRECKYYEEIIIKGIIFKNKCGHCNKYNYNFTRFDLDDIPVIYCEEDFKIYDNFIENNIKDNMKLANFRHIK